MAQQQAGIAAQRDISVWRTFRVFWPQLRRSRSSLVVAALFVTLGAAAETVAIYMFSVITDDVLAAGSLSAFWWPAGVWMGMTVLGGFASFGGNWLTASITENFLLRLRNELFAHVQRLSPSFFQRQPLGDLLARFSTDIEAVEALLASGVIEAFTALVTVVFFARAALFIQWELALVAFAVVPLFWLAARFFSARLKRASRAERTEGGRLEAAIQESLANVSLVQAYDLHEVEESRVNRRGVGWLRAKLAEARLTAAYTPLVGIVETFCVLAIIGAGTWEISAHRMTLGGLLSFAAFLGYLYPPIQELGQLTLTVNSATAAAERILALRDTAPEVTQRPDAVALTRSRGVVRLDGVGFSYPGSTRPALTDLSLAVEPGQLVVVTGPSGAGKSTVAKLLVRFYDAETGRIAIDGRDVSSLSLESLRHNVTLVSQEAALFGGSVAENIAYGRADVTIQQVESAARAADAHEFIAALPRGYDTEIGQGGASLSGGQRQRIALARAVLRDAPILVLDEPTAGLDAPSAARILRPLRRLASTHTTILITHDLTIAPDADRIYVLDRGLVVQQGTHHELLAAGGLYAALHRKTLRRDTLDRTTGSREDNSLVGRPLPRPSQYSDML
jgi:ATP-binding cassette subfamily B protein